MNTYFAGIDIGSTTVKLVVTDINGSILYGEYRRHCAHTQGTLCDLLKEAREALGQCLLKVKITGSGSINLGKAMGIGFVQEVAAVATALKFVAPQTDVAIELGGEDAKIIYFDGNNVNINYPAHIHSEIELILVKKGRVSVVCEDRQFIAEEGDICLEAIVKLIKI